MRYQLILPDDLAGWVADSARREGRSVSAWLRRLVEREHDRPKPGGTFDAKPGVDYTARVVGPPVHSGQPAPPSLATLRAQTDAVVQRPKRTALVASSDGRGGA
jgi:hypothetical protein